MTFMEERTQICEHCAIYSESTQQCSAYLYIDPSTNTAYVELKEGTVRGCGCYIPTKVKNSYNHCPAKKW